MSHLPPLISDLAFILILAGFVTILFKRLRQPLVLGYIVAGFLAGPHMPYTPSVTDMSSVTTWADIGVIFLMFTLGLEFSFKKIVKMGGGPIVAACTVMFCMIGVGSVVGHLFGWGSMDSLFLGGMLAMSSTTIIYKAFDDLGIRQQKFAGEVLSVLILEDILGILLMVVLSALAASRQFEGIELVGSMFKLAFFLILWFVVGVYLVPLFLRRAGRWMNKETLLIVSIGLCFLLVVLASKAGYSSAFGAFMMGSILAETLEAESIEHVVSPVKDLFGAIFFVSVGMLVNPAVLTDYWPAILAIVAAIITGQAVFGTMSFLISGQPLSVAVRGGFSLAQIGEFAFIIASLGVSLGVTGEFLYPVVVAVSIITTFLTPYMIRASVPAAAWLEKRMPTAVLRHIDVHSADRRHRPHPHGESAGRHLWKRLLTALISQVGAYLTLSVAVVLMALSVLLPLCRGLLPHWPANAACGLLSLLAAAPFLRAIVMRKNHSEEWKMLQRRGRFTRFALWLTVTVRFVIAAAVVFYLLNFLSPFPSLLHIAAAALFVAAFIASRRVKWLSIRLERTFLQNLRQREVKARHDSKQAKPGYAGRLESRNVHIAQMQLPPFSLWAGHTLAELSIGHNNGVLIAALVRGGRRLNIPDGETRLYPGDLIEAIGDDESLAGFAARMNVETDKAAASAPPAGSLQLRRVIIRQGSPLANLSLNESGIREQHKCTVIGFEDGEDNIRPATAAHVITPGDALWVVGEDDSLRALMQRAKGAKA